jgi:hypothetical protein
MFITLMMDSVSTSETSVCNETTIRKIPEDCLVNTRCRENPKSDLIGKKFTMT